MKSLSLVVMAITSVYLVGCGSDDQSPAPASAFYNKETLLNELPLLPSDSSSYAAATSNSYNQASIKGNDIGSTKKADLITWYDDIRHGDLHDPFRNFDGSDYVFREVPRWQPEHTIGVFSQPYAENALDYYNFMRALNGMQRVYMSGYKQVSAQASSWSDLGGGHNPTVEMGQTAGLSTELFNVARFGREGGNLMGGRVNKTVNYEIMKQLPRNGDLTRIWSEGEWDNIAGLGHRNSFMFYPGRDVGIGLVAGFHTWLSWGANPMANDGAGLGGADQKAVFDAYPSGSAPAGVIMHPSHGYYPFFALNDYNQTVSVKFNSAYVAPITVAKRPEDNEIINLTMEYYVHETDGDLSTLAEPVNTITLTDIVGSGQQAGGTSPGSQGADWVNPCKGDVSECPEGVQDLGGYHLTTSHGLMPLVFRMPYGWFQAMAADFAQAEQFDVAPKYHTVRYRFSSHKPDGSAGESLVVKQPFYMNPQVGQYLVLQTTHFDIMRQRD
ncbi:hypothetical protein [Shewanella sp. NIFS-20-20]|uniref:hypothetical protein n=1 Tax=Shewanella sp. NIFS-20-20 TaxID=2853806 RepID=UPI001C4667B0|nr:hypothetical protein [Shewanella sp. NIFS-20-20]MBV7317196.1 hypothetical protein [Shewanella sp. NIFS-20-20]